MIAAPGRMDLRKNSQHSVYKFKNFQKYGHNETDKLHKTVLYAIEF